METATGGAVGFYVTARSGKSAAFLLGPYATHDEALANVDRAKARAIEVYANAEFVGYGTAKATSKPGRELRPGKFNDVIGLTAAGE